MTNKRVVTGEIFVTLSEYDDPEVLKHKDAATVIKGLTFTAYDIGSSGSGYSRAGKATVTVELDDERTLIDNKAESLRAEIKKVQADAENAITQLREKLNSLLAIAA